MTDRDPHSENLLSLSLRGKMGRMLTTHTITLPTPEQRAVYAACEERYESVLSVAWRPNDASLYLELDDGDGHDWSEHLIVAVDGTARTPGGFVPTRLYGSLPKREDARREWGRGLPKYAVKHMPTPLETVDSKHTPCSCGKNGVKDCGQCAVRDGFGALQSGTYCRRGTASTPSMDDSGDEAMCECGAGEHESCRCATREQHGTSYHVREA